MISLLMLSFNGLRQLHFECSNCIKIDVNGIINHGETLTDLLVLNGGIHRQDATASSTTERRSRICSSSTEVSADNR